MKAKITINSRPNFDLTKRKAEIRTERFDKSSIFGINIAGITRKLHNIYINLERFSQENIV